MTTEDTEILSLIATVREKVQALFPHAVLPDVSLYKQERRMVVKAEHIDHTLLKATATENQIEILVQEAIRYGFASVCVNGRWVKNVARNLKGTGVKTCAVVGFPLGAMSSMSKSYEAKTAVEHGATRLIW